MKKNLLLILTVLVMFASCKQASNNSEATEVTQQKVSENLLFATAWYQQSAENQACYYQAFNIAKGQLIKNIETAQTTLPKAVIVDIDETMLDNSPFESYLIKNNKTYSEDLWTEWVQLEKAKSLPGAVNFTEFAKENNVTVFYVSNRKVNNLQPTLNNLQSEGFAYAEEKYVLLKDATSDKTERRNLIAKNYEIIMLIGDNLRDFDEIFNDRRTDFGHQVVTENKDLFGVKYIVLPNPMYGQWVKAYRNTDGDTPNEKLLENTRNAIIAY